MPASHELRSVPTAKDIAAYTALQGFWFSNKCNIGLSMKNNAGDHGRLAAGGRGDIRRLRGSKVLVADGGGLEGKVWMILFVDGNLG